MSVLLLQMNTNTKNMPYNKRQPPLFQGNEVFCVDCRRFVAVYNKRTSYKYEKPWVYYACFDHERPRFLCSEKEWEEYKKKNEETTPITPPVDIPPPKKNQQEEMMVEMMKDILKSQEELKQMLYEKYSNQ